MTKLHKMDLKSKDIKIEQIEKLKQLFPETITEGKIDFDKLKLTLGSDVDSSKEKYSMFWAGKSGCFKIIQEPSIGTLKPIRDDSVDFDNTENIFIEGDNLEVLKLLQKSYYEQIKMIYIDPPYNTGKDFVYKDKFGQQLDEYLKLTGQVDVEGKKLSTNTDADGRYHSNWMNMMYSRLFLAKNLLRDDGVIFISIDNNEITNLKKICDEIFGEDNAEIYIWNLSDFEESSFTKTASNTVRCEHEYIVACFKNLKSLKRYEEYRFSNRDDFANVDDDPRGEWMSGNISRNGITSTTGSKYFTITTPKGNEYTRNWTVSKEEYDALVADNRIYFSKEGEGVPRLKIFKSEPSSSIQSSIFSGLKTSITGKNQIKELFDGKILFDFAKPTNLIRRLIELTCNQNEIILDFFAGSGTTAQAVLEYNIDDEGNRKFICVQLPEPTAEDSEAFKAGYKNIAEICKERIRRVITRINKKQNPEQKKLKSEDKKPQDLGFKVFKLDRSNFKIWDTKVKDVQKALTDNVEQIKEASNPEDVLYEILLKDGFELTTSIKKIKLENKDVYSIEDNMLLICLDKHLTLNLFKDMKKLNPHRVVVLDKGFNDNDQLKTNAVQSLGKNDSDEYILRSI